MSGRLVNILALALAGAVVVGGLALYLRASAGPGSEPSEPPLAEATLTPSDSAALSETPVASVTLEPTDSPTPSETPTESPAFTPSSAASPSQPVESLEEFLASIAVPIAVDLDSDGESEWTVARRDSAMKLDGYADILFAHADRGLVIVGSGAQRDRSTVVAIDRFGANVLTLELPALSSAAKVLLTPDRQFAYTIDDSIERIDVETFERTTLVRGGSGYRDESSLSPSGRTLASSSCGDETCTVDLIVGDTASKIDRFVLLGVGDDYLIGYESNSARSWLAYSIQDGTRMALDVPMTHAWDGYALDDGRFLVSGSSDRDGWSMAIVDIENGHTTPIIDGISDSVVYEFWPSSRWAVIGPREGLEPVVTGAESLRVIDLLTGEFVAEVKLGPAGK